MASSAAARLAGMDQELDGLSSILATGLRQRREKDDARVTALKAQISAVEEAIALESERRLQMAASLREHVSTQVAALRTRIESMLAAAQTELQARIAEVHARITELEARFEKDKVTVLTDLETRHKDLIVRINDFIRVVTEEREARLVRERAILDRLTEEERRSVARYDAERDARESVYMATKARLESALETQAKAHEAFQAATAGELAALKNALVAEEKARLAEDEDIAETVTRYAGKLQATLAVLVSADTQF